MRLIWVGAFALVLTALGGPVSAQQAAAPVLGPERGSLDFGIIGRYTREATHPRENEFYRDDLKVRHEPGFIEPMTVRPQSGPIKKIGASGWTSPPGTGALPQVLHQEFSGWFGFGISAVWE
jgi:hypothetical protein